MRLITVENLSFYYEKEPVLEDISFYVDSGEFVCLTGENGAAKSTLLKLSLGLLTPQKGSVKRSATNLYQKPLKIGYLPQHIAAFNIGFPSNVYEFVLSGRSSRTKFLRSLTPHDHEHVQKALESVGMWGMRHTSIGQLSGGQKQRIVIARLFAMDPDIFVLDEPTTGMDIAAKTDFYQLMKHSVMQHRKAVLMVTHDALEVSEVADRVISLVRKEDSPWRCFHLHDHSLQGKKGE